MSPETNRFGVYLCVFGTLAATAGALWCVTDSVVTPNVAVCWYIWGFCVVASVVWLTDRCAATGERADPSASQQVAESVARAATDHCAIVQRTKLDGQHLTLEERAYIGYAVTTKQIPHCPDCGGPLCRGPEGGCSVNYGCRGCGSEFNIAVFGVDSVVCLVMAERLSDAGPREMGERAGLYSLAPQTERL